MFKKFLLLSCAVGALSACGGGANLDYGPDNTSSPNPPPPPEAIDYEWQFTNDSDLDAWTIEWEKTDNTVDSSLYIQPQKFALGIKAMWGADVIKNDSVTVFGTLDEPVDLRSGFVYMSLWYPKSQLGNPWGTAPWGNSAHHLGTQYMVRDSEDRQALLRKDSGSEDTWTNSFNVRDSTHKREDGRPAEGYEMGPTEDGMWIDLKIDVGLEVYDADEGFDLSSVVSVGLVLNYALEKPENMPNFPEYYVENEDAPGTYLPPEHYVFIDDVAVLPYQGDGPIPTPEPTPEPPEVVPCYEDQQPVKDPEMVFFNWNGQNPWWGNVTAEEDLSISLDGTSYGRANFQTGGTGWTDLFWRNGDSLGAPGTAVGTDTASYSLKFDINVFEPITAGTFKIRFNDSDGVDSFYDWAPWTTSGEPFVTDGWVTVEIPLADLGQPDFSNINEEFGMAFQDADILLDFAIDNVRFETPGSGMKLHPLKSDDLVFFDWASKGAWWGAVVSEQEADLTLDGSEYGRANFQTGGTGWTDLFWRNDDSLGLPGDVVGTDIAGYSLKFDINVLEPITAGTFKIRFNSSAAGDSFYDWAPWTASGEPFVTNGWVTVEIPLSAMSQSDYSSVDLEFGMAFQDADVLLNFAIDNVRFDAPGFACPGPEPVIDPTLVFYDWDGKNPWWGNVLAEEDLEISGDETLYGRANFATEGTGWTDLFWRNGGDLGVPGDTVGTDVDNYSLKFDLYTLDPITDGTFKIRFNSSVSGVDSFYDWAPWTASAKPFVTNGWTTITIPLADMSQTDYAGLDLEFGMAFQDADVNLNFAVDNVRFEEN